MIPESQLNLRSRHPDFQDFLAINDKESKRVRASLLCHLDVKYGSDPLQTLDIFPSNHPDSPIFIFIHGGYWRGLDKKSYDFVAEPFVKNNFTTCILNYRLIPSVDMRGIVEDVKAVIHWIQNKAGEFHGNPNQIVLCGHSAGGHLALLTYLINEHLRTQIKALCSLSGIFNLRSIQNSYLNEVLLLSDHDVELYSVSNKNLSVLNCPVLLSVGSDETHFFIEETKKLYEENRYKSPIAYYEYPGLNHYQIVHQLGKEDSPLVKFVWQALQ